MRPRTFAFANYLSSTLKEHHHIIQRLLFFIIFIPLVMLFFLLEWDFQVLVFILLGYSSAFLGFVVARQKEEKSLFSFNARRFNDLAIEHSDDIVLFSKHKNNEVLFASPSVYSILGYNPQVLKKQSIILLIHPEDRKIIQKQLSKASIAVTGGFTEKLRILKKNGEIVWMQFAAKLISNKFGQKPKIIIKLRDISATMELEIATRQLAEELREKQRKGFKSQQPENFPHVTTTNDLKEPLLTAKSYIRFFEHKFDAGLNEEGRECLHYVKGGLDQMEEMLEKVNAISDLGAKKIKLEKVSMTGMVKEVLSELKEKIVRSNTLVVYDGLPEIMGEKKQLKRLFHNLIENSIKYNHSERPIIRISCTMEKGNWLFQIRDNGIGIKPELSESVFNLFRQLNAPGRYPGSGTGLTICKTIANQHKGRIWVESEGEGKGCTFFIQIPLGNQIIGGKTKTVMKPKRSRKMVREVVPLGV